MFNNTSNNTNIKINAVSGILVKNYQKSFILRFQKGSKMEERVFDDCPFYMINTYDRKSIVVIQAMILADGHFLCEIMFKEDFDAMFSE